MISIGFAIGIVVLFAFGTIAYRLGCCGNRYKQVNDGYIPLSSTAHDGAEVELPSFNDEEDGQPPASASGFVLARVHKSLLGHPLVIHPQFSGAIQGNFPSAEERLDEMKKDGPLATMGQPGSASSSAHEDLEEGLEPPPPYEVERE
ncbi:hypothetical protein BN946_scf184985.g120 [Trametes cinnabarina]|uniref:Uncharacterized protein n=1 Tax=Pycnoporus cinnabarinus TaxID=5643 RepID=A0A060SEA1_PYCCI|nr:hypothetical protein BN946_scf184985.g120 [Trametes cinnabarina]